MKQLYSFIFFSMLFFLPVLLYGQNNLILPDFTASGGKYLNDQIFADTLANGTHDTTRVYILNRNGLYKVNGSINNNGWPLQVRASYGTGYPPFILLVPGSGQTQVPAQMILAGGKVYLTNLQITGYNETSPSTISTMNTFLINNAATGNTIVVDSCILSNVVRGLLWMNIAARYIKVTHSILANSGYLGNNDIGNGRAVDLRTGACDTLIIQNNTIINMQDRLIRHYSSTAPIMYVLFDHNTVVNNMSYHGFLSFGLMNAAGGSKGIVTNNLLLNPFALGNDTDATRQVEFADNAELDVYGRPRMLWVSAVPDPTTVWTFKKNYYGISAENQAFYSANLPSLAGVAYEGLALPWHINAKIGADSQTAFVKVPLIMTKVPLVMTAEMAWYRSPSGGNKTKIYSSWTLTNDMNRASYSYLIDSINCNFNCDVNLSTASLDGKVVGDTRWHWITRVGVDGTANPLPMKYDLINNYPNPFNPTTLIQYELPTTSHVVLKVYDILGRELSTLVNGIKVAGNYKLSFDASHLTSGVYFAQIAIQSENGQSFQKMIKMVLMK
jgi:hypothetical protein